MAFKTFVAIFRLFFYVFVRGLKESSAFFVCSHVELFGCKFTRIFLKFLFRSIRCDFLVFDIHVADFFFLFIPSIADRSQSVISPGADFRHLNYTRIIKSAIKNRIFKRPKTDYDHFVSLSLSPLTTFS